MSGTFNPVQMPDFGATWQRGQAFQQQQQQLALAMASAQREAAQQQQYEGALADPAITQGMLSDNPGTNRNALAMLAQRGGVRGFQAALPMIQKQQEDARIQALLGGMGMGGMGGQPPQPAPLMQSPQAMPPMDARPGGDVRQRNQQFAALRQQVMDNPNLSPPQQEDAMARISAAQAQQGSGLPAGPGYREPTAASEGGAWAAGLRPATGAVGGAVAPPGGAMPQPAGRPGMPSLPQVMAMIASGNQRFMEIGKAYLPILTRENNLQIVTQGGQMFLMDPRTGQRTPIGPADSVTEDTRTIGGRVVQGQTVNGRFAPYPDNAPPGYIRQDGRLMPETGGPAASEARSRDFSSTRQLREEFNSTQAAKDYAIVRPNYQAIQRALATDTRAADIDMVFAFAKMLDPNSVVREGEQLQLMRTGGVFDTVGGWISGLTGGGRLTPDVRAAIRAQADSRFGIAADAHDERLDYYGGLAEQNGFNPGSIGRTSNRAPAEMPRAAPAAGAMPRVATTAEAMALPSGTRFVGPDGVERVRP